MSNQKKTYNKASIGVEVPMESVKLSKKYELTNLQGDKKQTDVVWLAEPTIGEFAVVSDQVYSEDPNFRGGLGSLYDFKYVALCSGALDSELRKMSVRDFKRISFVAQSFLSDEDTHVQDTESDGEEITTD